MSNKYLTAPVPSKSWPKGILYIIGNEAAERFSFYGMKTILAVFMTQYLLSSSGENDPMSESDASFWVHVFNWGVYLTPLLGGLVADIFLGKYRTIILLSIVYCLGHFALALDETRLGLSIGLSLIAVGAGGIKPCVSAHVGDQFGKTNAGLLNRAFSWFYLAINLGAAISTILTPVLLDKYGPWLAFGIPGVLMSIATFVFWMGRWKFIHIPPGGKKWVKETFSKEGRMILGKLSIVFLFVAMFWALFDQTGSTWVFQAREMDRTIFGVELLESQIQAVNPILILTLIPIFYYGIYPWMNKYVFELTPMRRIAIGFFVAIPAFALTAITQDTIDQIAISGGPAPSIGWQMLSYLIITIAEILISITCLEFAYTQAPKTMKSIVMGFYLASVSVGNAVTAGVIYFNENADGTLKLEGADFFWFFTLLIAVTAILFLLVLKFYIPKTYIQDEE
jgi:POT family proton-dependent oligopeptide transporter